MGTGQWVGMGMRTGRPSHSSLSHCKPPRLGLGLPEPVPCTAQGQRGTRSKHDMTPALPPASRVPLQASCVSLPAPVTRTRSSLAPAGAGIQLQTHQQGDDSVPRQDHVSSPRSWAAFRISAEGVTRREHSEMVAPGGGTERVQEWEGDILITQQQTPTPKTVSLALCDVP